MNEAGIAFNKAKHKVEVQLGKIRQRVELGTKLADQSGGVTWAHVGDLNYLADELRKLIGFLDDQDGLED